jgi:DNA repair protein RadC
MTLHLERLPLHERPRERLLQRGAEALSERELLALVLRQGAAGMSALDVAADLVATYGSLAAIASAAPEELARHPGIGTAKAAAIVAAFRLGQLAGAERPTGRRLQGPEDIVAVVRGEFIGLRRERVVTVVCDATNRVRRVEVIAAGSSDRSTMPVREVLNCVLRHDGRGFAVAHNHPSGDPSPSDADLVTSRELRAAAKTVGLRFLDHVIVAGDQWASAAT